MTTVDRYSLQLRVVGYSALALFARATDGSQPEDRAERAIAANEGAFQLPLWPAHPPLSGPLCAGALHARPRLPCASVLVRVAPAADLRSQKCALSPSTPHAAHLSAAILSDCPLHTTSRAVREVSYYDGRESCWSGEVGEIPLERLRCS